LLKKTLKIRIDDFNLSLDTYSAYFFQLRCYHRKYTKESFFLKSEKEMEMKVLVLGGCGIQGRAALFDLTKHGWASTIVVADMFPDRIQGLSYLDHLKIMAVRIDADDQEALVSLMNQGFDVVLDFLPPHFIKMVAEASIRAGVSLVNTNYAYQIHPLHDQAVEKEIIIIPECGLDPGIDLVLYHYGMNQFDELHVLNSYCGGLPEKPASKNPLSYKISWNWDAVLKSQNRNAVLVIDGKPTEIAKEAQHDNPFIHEIDFPGIGRLEALPNGNAVHFIELLGLSNSIRETGRYSLRWPGWSSFWNPLKKFGCFSDSPVAGLACDVSPHEFFVKWLEPQLQYDEDEKDLAVMQNVFIGTKDGRKKKLTLNILIKRDLATGLMGMALGVSYAACIAAEMIAKGEITKKGILSPVRDMPVGLFLERLKDRGVKIEERIEQ
jgi:saccharopine dehydrogenase-like NADP-dependent oxidoreductase